MLTHILVAPNAFKHSLDAGAAAAAIALGLERSKLDCRITCFPICDGGDGTCELIHTMRDGRSIPHIVHDPLGRKITATYSLINDGDTAVIEMADASGLRLLNCREQNPMLTSSRGTGELICHALDHVKRIILGMGGSATVDGGCGILHALGARFYDASGKILQPFPKELMMLEAIDLTGLDNRLSNCDLTVLCDVSNKLLGAEGAATVFGPQKGASAKQVGQLEAFLTKLSVIAERKTRKRMATVISGGAAGGAAAGMFALADARLVNGNEFFLDITGFDNVLDDADWVVTGEGSLDDQTLGGKGPWGVARRAKQRGLPVICLAGKVPLAPSEPFSNMFDIVLPIGNEPETVQNAFDNTVLNLQRTARMIGNIIEATIR